MELFLERSEVESGLRAFIVAINFPCALERESKNAIPWLKMKLEHFKQLKMFFLSRSTIFLNTNIIIAVL